MKTLNKSSKNLFRFRIESGMTTQKEGIEMKNLFNKFTAIGMASVMLLGIAFAVPVAAREMTAREEARVEEHRDCGCGQELIVQENRDGTFTLTDVDGKEIKTGLLFEDLNGEEDDIMKTSYHCWHTATAWNPLTGFYSYSYCCRCNGRKDIKKINVLEFMAG